MKLRIFALAMLCLATLIGCGGQTADPPQTLVRPADGLQIDPGRQPSAQQQQQMLAAKEAMFEALSERLMAAMGSGGPAAAIGVCQQKAPEIAEKISREHGLQIGRTGVRLRNPRNLAPAWAEPWIEQRSQEPQFAMLSDGQSAALLPIKLQVQCLMCHGPQDQILPEVKAQLVDRYPDDQATEFHEGDLRGWFWIQLPAEEPTEEDRDS